VTPRPPRPGRAAEGRRSIAALLLGGLVLGAGVVIATILVAWAARERTLAEAGREARNIAFVLANQTERAIEAVDLALEATLERGRAEGALRDPAAFGAWAGSREVHAAMTDRLAVLPPLDAIVLNDRTGMSVGTSRSWPPLVVANGEREYFRSVADGRAIPYVAEPIQSRATGEWVVPVARRIEGATGEFLGVALGPIRSAYFRELYAALSLGESVSINLLRADGILLARAPQAAGLIGTNMVEAPIFAGPQAVPDGTPVRLRGPDGVERLKVGQALSRFPLRVHVGLGVEEVLAPWRRAVVWLALGALVLLAVLAAAVAAAIRLLRSEARAAVERGRLNSALTIERDDFRLAMEGMSQAVWRFDPAGRLTLTNGRSARLLGLPDGAPPIGMTPEALRRLAEESRLPGLAELLRRVGQQLAAGDAASFLHDMPDGRTLAVLWRTMHDGGALATFEDVTERHAAEARARFLARHDGLTGLPNRLGLQEHLDALLPRLAARGGQAALLYFDLDRFKEVNDTLGHPAGDALLQAVVERIRHRARADRDGGDFIARLGGDEFALVTAPTTGLAGDAAADATAIAERLVRAIAQPFDLDGNRVVVGVSIGIALCPADGPRFEDLLRHADLALYRAKNEGRGRWRFFQPEMSAASQARRGLELELRRALELPGQPEFVLEYQPLVAVASHRVTGFEALLRWHHPERGLIPPAEFIPVAEEIGLIDPLGELVLARACREAAGWPAPVPVAVNVSALQLRHGGLVAQVARILAESGLDPGRLELEITEGALLRSTERTVAALHRLRAAGVRVALDDFGTGYSSLSHLLAFPFDKIKVDRAFTGQAVTEPNARAIIRAVAGLCAQLGVTMTAEGVETEAQLALLVQEGCQEAQGYLFGRPAPAGAVPGTLARLGHGARPGGAVVALAQAAEA